MVHWNHTENQKEKMQRAIRVKVPKADIMQYFYPDVSAEQMHMMWKEASYSE